MKIRKSYATIPDGRKTEFMRLFPAARLHAWPNTWSFPTGFKAEVDAFLGKDSGVDSDEDSFDTVVAVQRLPPGYKALAIPLSPTQIHALEHLTRRITAGTIEAFARNLEEKAQMQSALNILKAALRAELARSK